MDESFVLELLNASEIDLEGRVAWGSNYTLLGSVCREDDEIRVIYKPRRGERPLWDFSEGSLCGRERAAYLISHALAWDIVPPTILREGPMGFGSVQLFIEHDPNIHYFNFQGELQYEATLKQIVLFDLIVNNADRKSGHVLRDDADRLWTIDHGLCFHAEYKLRTVIWDFAGMEISAENLSALSQLTAQLNGSDLQDSLLQLLTKTELEAIKKRIDHLTATATFPQPGPGRHYPWPPV